MPSSAPAVRSIRVASALNDRFGAILRDIPHITEAPEMELRIGEAQQIYPEIWRHLDEARAELVRRGVRVDDFDALRATEHPAQQAVGNIESADLVVNPFALAFGSLEVVRTKSATFHKAGHEKARDACNALMRAMPAIDWHGLAKHDDAQIAAVGSLSAAKWRNAVIAAVVVIAVIVALKALA